MEALEPKREQERASELVREVVWHQQHTGRMEASKRERVLERRRTDHGAHNCCRGTPRGVASRPSPHAVGITRARHPAARRRPSANRRSGGHVCVCVPFAKSANKGRPVGGGAPAQPRE